MKITRFILAFIVASTLLVQPISAQELLAADDVHRIMDQIFRQHVNKNEITGDIVRKSLRIYIDQFDPKKIYLLEEEVNPFLNLTEDQVAQVIGEYKKNELTIYQKLNDVIVKAIERAQVLRKEIDKEGSHQLNASAKPMVPSSFATNLQELKKRQRGSLASFLAKEEQRYGHAYIANNRDRLVSFYDKKQRYHESQYLPTTANGAKMAANDIQHQFLIHVLKALAASLDSHTTVFDDNEAFDMRIRLKKGFSGIGITIVEQADGFFVTDITPGAPADKSGRIKRGDQIVAIDDQKVDDLDLNALEDLLRGQAGTNIQLLIKSPNQSSTNLISLTREMIVINEGRVQVSYENFGNGIIGKIKLDSFYQGPGDISSVNDVKKAIDDLDAKGNLRGLILDLRENTGGFLSQAVKVAGLFITNGVVVISKYHSGEQRFYRDMDSSVAYDGPLVILTSKATASAAEIVAQALQDYGVAVIVGDEQTYGKGTIQSQTVTSSESDGSYFKVTVGQYYTVSGKTPQFHGVKADIIVPGKYSMMKLGEEYLDYPKAAKHAVIDAAYSDSLNDIRPALKSWYMRYYMPTLQQPRAQWKSIIPQLQDNSQYRLKNNENYQFFLKRLRGEKIVQENDGEADEYGRYHKNNYGKEDLQLQEAVNIVKDMIYLQPKVETISHK